jgi:hypothetical protein
MEAKYDGQFHDVFRHPEVDGAAGRAEAKKGFPSVPRN